MIIDASHYGPDHPQILLIVHCVQTLLYFVDIKLFFGHIGVSFDSLVVAHDQSPPTWTLYLVKMFSYH